MEKKLALKREMKKKKEKLEADGGKVGGRSAIVCVMFGVLNGVVIVVLCHSVFDNGLGSQNVHEERH